MSQRHFVYEESKKLCGLKIINSKASDTGVYSIVVDNQFGRDESSAQINVISKNQSTKGISWFNFKQKFHQKIILIISKQKRKL